MIRLYSIPPSVYSAKVRIVLRAKGLAFEDVLPPGGYGSAEYKALVPYGTLPAIDHDGFVLADSEAINEYLEEIAPEPRLWPSEPRARARARMLSRFHDTRLEPALRALFRHVKPTSRDAAFITAQVPVIRERLEQMSGLIAPAPLLTGDKLSLCDCGYAITLEMLTQLNGAMRLDLSLPDGVARYMASLRHEPSVATELKTYGPALAAWISGELAG